MEQILKEKTPLFEQNPIMLSLYGFINTKLLITFHQLGIFKEFSGDKKLDVQTVADNCNLDSGTLARTLEAAASWGLLTKDGSRYFLPPSTSQYVEHDSESFLGPIIEHFDNNTIPLFDFLGDALKDGQPQWNNLANKDKKTELKNHAFENIFDNPEYSESFHKAMWNLSFKPSLELAKKCITDNNIKNLVDLGGGSGAFSVAACQKTPQLEAIVLDLPEVKAHCEKNIEKHKLNKQIQFVPGDFWKSEFPKSECYALGYVLSNWSDEDCIKLLKRVHTSLHTDGKLIILERLLEEDRSGPFVGIMQDLAMLLETGGMHRSLSHYEYILREAGFMNISCTKSSYDKHAVIGIKK